MMESKEMQSEEVVKLKTSAMLQWGLYALGAILIILSIWQFSEDVGTLGDPYFIDETRYVGGDAYNFIITAARSTAIMVKSLILAVLGCTSIISGLLLKMSQKQ